MRDSFPLAPEILGKDPAYDRAVDWWALGSMMFRMMSGRLPFEGGEEYERNRELFDKILRDEVVFSASIKGGARSLFKVPLTKNPG